MNGGFNTVATSTRSTRSSEGFRSDDRADEGVVGPILRELAAKPAGQRDRIPRRRSRRDQLAGGPTTSWPSSRRTRDVRGGRRSVWPASRRRCRRETRAASAAVGRVPIVSRNDATEEARVPLRGHARTNGLADSPRRPPVAAIEGALVSYSASTVPHFRSPRAVTAVTRSCWSPRGTGRIEWAPPQRDDCGPGVVDPGASFLDPADEPLVLRRLARNFPAAAVGNLGCRLADQQAPLGRRGEDPPTSPSFTAEGPKRMAVDITHYVLGRYLTRHSGSKPRRGRGSD